MLKDNCVFIGVGQGGGNIVSYLEHDDFDCFYVNTSLDDLESISASVDKRYAINGTKGMAKDIDFAYETITSDYNDEKVCDAIYKKYPNAKIYFIVFTAGGGTGGGMGNVIASTFKELHPDRTVNIVTVLPHSEEDMKMQYNAIKCIEKIQQNVDNGYVNCVQILDNNKFDFGKKLEINTKFALYMSDVMNFESSFSENGNLDEEEMERLFTSTSGLLNIHEIKNDDFLDNLDKLDSIYIDHTKDVQTHGLILNESKNDSTNLGLIREAFGMPVETHSTTWQDTFSIIISVGMSFNNRIIEQLKKNYLNLKKLREDIANRSVNKEEETIDVDFSDMIKSKQVIEPTKTPRTRRRQKTLGVRAENSFRISNK